MYIEVEKIDMIKAVVKLVQINNSLYNIHGNNVITCNYKQ